MYAVVTRMWACEDAYITFRYIDNLVHGFGLVYNVGEHVEGFTHPAWLFLVSIPSFIGVSIRASALWLSLLCTLIGLWIVAFRDRDCQGMIDVFGYDPRLIEPVTTEELSQSARRPAATGYITLKAETVLGVRPMGTRQGLALFRRELLAGRWN